MLPDPVTIAVRAPTPELVLKVIRSDGYGTERVTADQVYGVKTNHEKLGNKGERHWCQISQTKDAVNPLTGGTSRQVATVSISVAIPAFGWSATEKAALAQALIDYLLDSEVTLTRFIGYES